MPKPKVAAPYKRSITVKITSEIIEEIEKTLEDPSWFVKWLQFQVINGNQVTFKPDFKTDGVSTSIMPIDSTNENAGIMLFANASDVVSSAACCAAKINSLGTETPWLESPAIADNGRFS